MRWLTARHRADERGATIIIVSALASTIMVMAAFVIDVGALVQERRELQNGADAAALAIAQSCGLDPSGGDCATDATAASAAGLYADENALDGTSAVDSARLDKTAGTVTVVTSTLADSGSTIVPFTFARVIGLDGKTLHATAVAQWGAPGSAFTIPLAISVCEFDAAGLGTAITLRFHADSRGEAGCFSEAAGKDIAGGFGWLDTTPGAGCGAAIDANSDVSADAGASVPRPCSLPTLLATTVLVPIFDNLTLSGTKATYHIVGFGAFHLAGYRFPGQGGGTPVPCKSPELCISGRFTRFVDIDGGRPTGGPSFGVATISLIA